ncbi:hypothetical protein [Vibrio intestinalis]|uniref:hypothetical protein n=1 Tax=Vibrio intestinalis TaxID=2933291 RepID=UPI0021A9087A|nr:hypothetical protein [Vibrio intestinalis]
MNKPTLLIIVIACLLGYFIYDRYVVQPKQLNSAAQNMLTQMAIKQQWFDPLELLSDSSNSNIQLNKEIESAFQDGDMVYANGKITYRSETSQVCKIVDFRFRYGSLNDYEIFTQSDCSL